MSFNRKHFSFLFLILCCVGTFAQNLVPVTRFYAEDNPYVYYNNEFLSGFMQTGSRDSNDGFLQIPFVGEPLFVYVGEKDSTQYMAYASGYEFKNRRPDLGKYEVELTRYNIKGKLSAQPAYSVQEYVYPDTTADKGFLIDLDHAMSGAGNEDMNVYLIDKYTLRAYKRSETPRSDVPELYYYARFSHPFKAWNIRRERVTLENGSKETRCKVALTFALKSQEKLTVKSTVSTISSDKAYALLEGHLPAKHFNDISYKFFDDDRDVAQVVERKPIHEGDVAAKSEKVTAVTKKNEVKRSERVPLKHRQDLLPVAPAGPVDYIEIMTKEADLRAAFYAAVSILKQHPVCRKVKTADEFFKAITPLYRNAALANSSVADTDSLLHAYAKSMFSAAGGQATSPVQAAWFVFNAIGFRPIDNAGTYELVRPLFNVTTLHLSYGRRFILHTKNNSARNNCIESATLMRQPLAEGNRFTHRALQRGGVLAVKMTRPQ